MDETREILNRIIKVTEEIIGSAAPQGPDETRALDELRRKTRSVLTRYDQLLNALPARLQIRVSHVDLAVGLLQSALSLSRGLPAGDPVVASAAIASQELEAQRGAFVKGVAEALERAELTTVFATAAGIYLEALQEYKVGRNIEAAAAEIPERFKTLILLQFTHVNEFATKSNSWFNSCTNLQFATDTAGDAVIQQATSIYGFNVDTPLINAVSNINLARLRLLKDQLDTVNRELSAAVQRLQDFIAGLKAFSAIVGILDGFAGLLM